MVYKNLQTFFIPSFFLIRRVVDRQFYIRLSLKIDSQNKLLIKKNRFSVNTRGRKLQKTSFGIITWSDLKFNFSF